MSLINDALKRAKQSQQQYPQTSPAPSLPPVEVPRGGPSWFFPVAIILLVAVAGVFIVFAFFINQKPVAQITPVPPSAPPAAATAMQKAPPPAATVQVAAVVPPKPLPPVLKVQGIFYNNAQWQAIVNGQSVFVGDSVNGFRVKLISKNDVSFVAPDGTEKTMTLGE